MTLARLATNILRGPGAVFLCAAALALVPPEGASGEPSAGFVPGEPVQQIRRAGFDVLADGQVAAQFKFLRQIPDAQSAPPRDLAGIGWLFAAENLQETGLAAAVAPDQTDAVALLNAERDVVKDGVLVVAHGDFGGGNDGGHANSRIFIMAQRVESKSA